MRRRALLVALMVVLVWAGPASAQTIGDPIGDYPPTISPTTLATIPPVSVTTLPPEVDEEEVEAAGVSGGDLAKTGANNILPLIQAAIVLMGAGTLLVLVARRRP